MTGYIDCACRDCFEIAIGKQGKAMCHLCEEAGCELDSECQQDPTEFMCEHGNFDGDCSECED